WYEKAADKGDAYGMTGLGTLYAEGWGVTKDYAKAREWYEKAADKGSAGAMVELGGFYENGHGGARDFAKAREWYQKTANKDDEDAKARLERLRATSEAAGVRRKAPQR